jgi:integrase
MIDRLRNPPFVHEYGNRHGTLVYYLRRPGHAKVRLRIPDGVLPCSPRFMEIYEAALSGLPDAPSIGANRTVAGTVNAALVSYYQSASFKSLAQSTQQTRRAIIERFREEHGDKRIALMHRAAMQAILNNKTPGSARNWKKAMRGFLDHCLSLNMIKVDPLAGVTMAKMKKTKGHHPWEAEECAQFEAHHAIGTRARLAYELLLQVGQSRCDVVRMGRQHVRNGVLSLQRQKTKVEFDVPVMPMLLQAIEAMPPSNHMMFLMTGQGKPFTAAGFGNWFRDICNEAELPKRCTSHGLRKAAATRAADRGATTTQLMAWFGWKSASEAERYTQNADRKRASATLGKLILETGS